MENASDALIMAGAVLLFIIALTVSISSFTNVKVQAEDIIYSRQEIDEVIDTEGNYFNYITSTDDVRTVGGDTVISAIRRVLKENFVVYVSLKDESFKLKSGNEKLIITDKYITKKYPNLSRPIINNKKIIEFSLAKESGQKINKILDDKRFYETIIGTEKKYKEYLGIFQDDSEVSESNKETYRVITFVEE